MVGYTPRPSASPARSGAFRAPAPAPHCPGCSRGALGGLGELRGPGLDAVTGAPPYARAKPQRVKGVGCGKLVFFNSSGS